MPTNRDRNHSKAIAMLRGEGFDALSTPTLPPDKNGNVIQRGRADITFLRGGCGGYIECKAGWERFPLENWREDQRRWAAFIRERCLNEYWIFLTLGNGRVNAKVNRDRTWLVPYEAWLAMESRLEGIQRSLVYDASHSKLLAIRNGSLDAPTLLSDFELQWGSGSWVIPEGHAFRTMYLVSPPRDLYHLETAPLCTPDLSTVTSTAR